VSPRRAHGQRGAALLLAMLILTLVATFAAAMLWQQWRAIEVEGAERARAQAAWLIEGTSDWARIILREDARSASGKPPVDSSDENWAIPLRDAKLSDFLATDRNQTDLGGIEATLSGQIVDAQSRFNLRNLVPEDATEEEEDETQTPEQIKAAKERREAPLRALRRLCSQLGLAEEVADRINTAMQGLAARPRNAQGGISSAATGAVAPQRPAQLAWLGLDAATVQRLTPYVVVLPTRTPVNVNTTSAEVLAAVFDGLDRGSAERVLRGRPAGGYPSLDAVKQQLGGNLTPNATALAVSSSFFEIVGELRYDRYVLREQTLVQRRAQDVVVLRRERLPLE